MAAKQYRIDFFRVQVTDDLGREQPFYPALTRFADHPDAHVREIGGVTFEIRDLRSQGAVTTGVLARLRMSDLPHAARPGRRERELDLADDEGLLEKSHFVFSRRHSLLAFQSNRLAAGAGKFGQFFSSAFNTNVVCHPVLQADAMRRLIDSDGFVRQIDVTVARPGPAMIQPRDRPLHWGDDVIGLLARTGGHKVRSIIQANGHATDRRRFLNDGLMAPLGRLMDAVHVTRARVRIETDDPDDPGIVDLLQDRLSEVVTVNAIGRYPDSGEMWVAIQRALRERRQQIEEVLGRDDQNDG